MPKKIELPIEEIISYYQSGMSPTKIGEKYGVGQNTIRERLKKNGVKLRPRGGKINLPVEEIISYYESGMSPTKIGEKYGVSNRAIYKRLKENDVKPRPRDKSKINLPIEEIISYYESGLSTTQLGEKYGVGQNTIYRRLKENGVKIRSSRSMNRIDLPTEEIISEYQSGLSTTQLGEKYGVHSNTIQNRLKENGVKLRYRGENFTISYNRREKKND